MIPTEGESSCQIYPGTVNFGRVTQEFQMLEAEWRPWKKLTLQASDHECETINSLQPGFTLGDLTFLLRVQETQSSQIWGSWIIEFALDVALRAWVWRGFTSDPVESPRHSTADLRGSPLQEGNEKKPMYYKFYSFRKVTLNVGGVPEEYQVTTF